MVDLLSIIKQASVSAVSASSPAAVLFGVVTAGDPIEVQVDARFTLPAALLILPESLTRYELELRHVHDYIDTNDRGSTARTTDPALPEEPIVIRRGLEVGDKVMLLRVQGGQQYVILDRVVSVNDTGD